MQRLILLRHAKAETYTDDGSDEVRKLNDKGRSDAAATADRLHALNLVPDCALVSVARRTRETWMIVSKLYPDCDTHFCNDLYLAPPNVILQTIKDAGAVSCAVLVGHNPGLHGAALEIARRGGIEDAIAGQRLNHSFPTGSAAIYEAATDAPFDPADFRLTGFISPKYPDTV